MNKIKLNLGCGHKYMKGWVNCDNSHDCKIDLFIDLDTCQYPFKDGEVDEILLSAVFEHVQNPIRVLRECHRILKPGGTIKIIVPHFSCATTYAPVHFTVFSWRWFDFFVKDTKVRQDYFNFKFSTYTKKKLCFSKGFHFWNYLFEPLFNLIPHAYEYTPLRVFSCMHLLVELKK